MFRLRRALAQGYGGKDVQECRDMCSGQSGSSFLGVQVYCHTIPAWEVFFDNVNKEQSYSLSLTCSSLLYSSLYPGSITTTIGASVMISL
jgi:hypothetical protein